ncbi:MAG: hypothetical protein IKU46_02670 [Peptococcaceae bacterium]|nr:hypothetical protein [Peptococcaceae bacterium]
MRKQHAPRATLFLMELVIVIFFFSICAAICVNVFGSARQMAKDSDNLSKAVIEARSAASCYKAAEGDLQETALLLDGVLQDGQPVIFYDKQWNPGTQPHEDGFLLYIDELEQYGEANVIVLDLKADEPVFQLPVKTSGGGGLDETE